MPLRVREAAPVVLVGAGPAACAIGLIVHRMDRALPWLRFGDLLLLGALSLGLAWLLRRCTGWSWAGSLGTIWLGACAFFVGVPALPAAALLAAAGAALGSLLVPHGTPARLALALPVGLVLVAGIAGWLLPLPVHRWYVLLPALSLACVARAPALREMAFDAWRGLRAADAGAPRAAAFAVALLGLASIGTWLPTMHSDDLAYHLGLPSQLARNGFYALDARQQFWALAPWLGDVVQGLAQVLAGREARGAVNALWTLSAASSLWWLAARLGADLRLRWLVVALFASLPPLAALATGMQTELPATALLLALALAIVQARERDLALAGAALAAGLAALKLGHAVAMLALLAWAFARARGRVDPVRSVLALLLFGTLAGSSYFYAWRISGNPLLPLFNDVFRSDLLAPQQLDDPRWHAGFGIGLPWSITFDTDRYLEAWDGGFGFVLVALAGAWLSALLRRSTRGFALAASGVFALALLPMQYARYAFPGVALLLPAWMVAAQAAVGARSLGRIAVVLCLLQLAFQANASWLLHVSAVRQLLVGGGRVDEVLRRYAPERALIEELRRRDDGDSIVLALDRGAPFVAELAGRGRNVAHYAPALEAARIAAEADPSGAAWRGLIDSIDARWLLLRPGNLSDAQRAARASSGALRAVAVGEAELWSLPAAGGTSP